MWTTNTAAGHAALLTALDTWLTTNGAAYGITYSGTGNGTMSAYSGGASSVAETFTLTATGATTFTVSGSVTGALGDLTVGTPYDTAYLKCTITAGGTAFVASDVFTVNTAPKWTQQLGSGGEYIWKAPGNDGTSSIYVGAKTFSNVTGDYYNWRLLGCTSYNAGLAWASQPGAVTNVCLPLTDGTIEYWFVADGRRVIVVAKASTYYETAYLGTIDAYGTPAQYPYPLLVGGSMAWQTEPADTSGNWRWSYTGYQHSSFAIPMRDQTGAAAYDIQSQARLRTPAGTWRGFWCNWHSESTYNMGEVWPYTNGMTDIRPCLDDTYPLFPIVLHDKTTDGTINCWGQLAGVAATTGYSASAEDTIAVGLNTWLMVQNVHRTTRYNYFAVKLD